MRKIVKYILKTFYQPLLVRYMAVGRNYTHRGIRLHVYPGVFHPGFFYSTKMLLRHIASQPLENRSFLELGAGSGLISLFAAGRGARVTATDINPQAVACLQENKILNGAEMEILQSDLFRQIPQCPFDIIAVNPPYYRQQPATDAEHAWYCGENGEYFSGFFDGLQAYTHGSSQVWMVLCDGCDLDMIHRLAGRHGWALNAVVTRENLVERNYIFRIDRLNGASPGPNPAFEKSV